MCLLVGYQFRGYLGSVVSQSDHYIISGSCILLLLILKDSLALVVEKVKKTQDGQEIEGPGYRQDDDLKVES